MKRQNLAITACGVHVRTLRELDTNVKVTAVCDIEGDAVLQKLKNEGHDTSEWIVAYCERQRPQMRRVAAAMRKLSGHP